MGIRYGLVRVYIDEGEHPSHPIVIPPDIVPPGEPVYPSHPIYLPGTPTHPIYNPPYPDQGLPGQPPYPAHPIAPGGPEMPPAVPARAFNVGDQPEGTPTEGGTWVVAVYGNDATWVYVPASEGDVDEDAPHPEPH